MVCNDSLNISSLRCIHISSMLEMSRYLPNNNNEINEYSFSCSLDTWSYCMYIYRYAPYTNLYVKSTTNDPSDPFFSASGVLESRPDSVINEEYEACAANYESFCGFLCSHGFTLTINVKRTIIYKYL